MSTYLPLAAPSGPASTEDSMEVYSDPENGAAAEDGIDIDLDLTSDPLEYPDGDQMIDDGEVDVEGDAVNPDVNTGHDEQMIDETAEDIGLQHVVIEDIISEHDEDLDDTELAKPSDQLSGHGEDLGQLPQSRQRSLIETSQEVAQSVQAHSSLLSQDFRSQSADVLETPGDVQDANDHLGIYGENRVEELTRKKQSPSVDASCSPKPSDTAEEMQLVQGQYQQHEDQLNAFTLGPFSPLSGSRDLSDDAAAKSAKTRSRTAMQKAGFSLTDDAPQSDAAEWDHSYHNFSTVPVTHQDDATTRRMDVPDEPQEREDASTVPETVYSQDTDASPEEPYIHPILVWYEESEMFLFPPAVEEQDNDQTYFLSNEALVAEPIQILLRECRNVLEENISDQQELEININALGLRISESSVNAADTTLAHILDVYLQLHYHDGDSSPPPMVLSLTTSVRFSHRLDFLSSLVANGNGISQIVKEENPIFGPDLPQITEELQAVHNNGQASIAPEDTIKEPILDEIHDQHHTSDQRLSALKPTENRHGGIASANSSTSSMFIDKAEMTEGNDVNQNATTTDSILLASDPKPVNPNIGSPGISYALESSEPNSNLPDEAEEFQEIADNYEKVEDRIDYEECEDDSSEESSAGSSTVQGDELHVVKNVISGALIKKQANNDMAIAAPELVIPKSSKEPATEDVITYDSADEGDDNGDPGNGPFQGTRDVNPESRGAVLVKPKASPDTIDSHTHDAAVNNEANINPLAAQARDVSALGVEGSNSNYKYTDQEEGDELETESAKNEAPYADECEESYRDSTLDDPTSQEVLNSVDYNNDALQSVITHEDDEESPINTARLSTQSVVDEDEITFDDELEEPVIERSIEAPTVYSSGQRAAASPKSLKRAHDDGADNDDSQDTKRVCSGR